MLSTPSGLRLHIGLVGRRNVGKSSLLNAFVGQESSIVSDVPGTTTDPVFKPFEDHEVGPLLLIDTAGLDDEGRLGAHRAARTRRVLRKLDVAVLVGEAGRWTAEDARLLDELAAARVPTVVALNKADLEHNAPTAPDISPDRDVEVVATSATRHHGLAELRSAVRRAATSRGATERRPIVGDLVRPGDTVVLVVPVDAEAPVGRLILPQVLTLRDVLDHGCLGLVVRDTELAPALARLAAPPGLVVTDSQAFAHVAATVPPEIPLTSFSIALARLKGDIHLLARGAESIAKLEPGARVLVAEACSHHPVDDDIGREKIPRLLEKQVGGSLIFDFVNGHSFEANLSDYALVVHCGACTLNRAAVLSRLSGCVSADIPVTNYGLAIAACLGLLERVTAPFLKALPTAVPPRRSAARRREVTR